ncbi:MAG: Ig-like protein, partial [Phenylobacterium sp.]|nr:Ig-like protein [Phenylobacterium sp.]
MRAATMGSPAKLLQTRSEVAFIDASLGEVEVLLQGLRSDVEPVLLVANAPALGQMAAALAGRRGLSAIHVIAHGQPGEVLFAGGGLSLGTVAAGAQDLAEIGRALDDEGCLCLWSCRTGHDHAGARFVAALAEATGAQVAAATDLVGAQARGGAWRLDRMAQAPLSPEGVAAYGGVLTVTLDLDSNTAGNAATTSYTENAGAVLLVPNATVSTTGGTPGRVDVVTITLTGPTATQSLGLDATGTSTAASAGVTVSSYNPATGVLTLTGTGTTDANWTTILKHLQYTNTSDAPAGSATVTFVATDNGGPSSDTRADAITIISVNDAPAGANATVTTLEDTAYAFHASDFGFTDVDGNALAAVKISTLPAVGAGTLLFNGVAITQSQVTAGYEVSAVDLAANKLTFAPAANANGAGLGSFTFQVRDDG